MSFTQIHTQTHTSDRIVFVHFCLSAHIAILLTRICVHIFVFCRIFVHILYVPVVKSHILEILFDVTSVTLFLWVIHPCVNSRLSQPISYNFCFVQSVCLPIPVPAKASPHPTLVTLVTSTFYTHSQSCTTLLRYKLKQLYSWKWVVNQLF